MIHRILVRSFLAAFLAGSGSLYAADPLSAMALAPPRPIMPGRDDSAKACAEPRDDAQLGLVEVVDIALCRQPQTREVWANARAQAAQVGVAESALLPSISASLGMSRDWSSTRRDPQNESSASLSLSWLLADFGGRSATIENARQLLAAAAATQDNTVQAVFLAAVQAFYQAQSTSAASLASAEAERASRAAFEAAEARYRVGSGTSADALQARTSLSQATLNRIRAEGEARNARGALAAILGRDAQRPVLLAPLAEPVSGTEFRADVDALVAEARRRRPDLAAAEAQSRAAMASVDVARAGGLPSLSLVASGNRLQVDGGLATHGGSIGVNLTVPLFSGFATSYRVRAAQESLEAREAQVERLRLQVALDVWNAYQNLLTATQALSSSADLVSSAEQSERVALGRYRAGVGGIVDTLNAQSALASARQQRIAAGHSWHVARAALAQAMGRLDLGFVQELATPAAAGKDRP